MTAPHEAADIDIRGLARGLWRRRRIVGLLTFVTTATALVLSFLQVPVYQATAELLLQARSTDTLFDPQSGGYRDPNRALQTEIRVLRSQPVRLAVRQRIGVAPPVAVGAVGQTDVIQVRAKSTDPRRAAIVANAYARAYVDYRRRQAVDDLLEAGKEVQRKVNELQTELDAIGRGPARPDQAARIQIIQQQQALFKQKLDQLQVDAALRTGGAQLVTAAVAPVQPIEPRPRRAAVLAFVVGLLTGTAAAFVLEYLDDSIKSKDEIEDIVPEAPVVATVPLVSEWKQRDRPYVVTLDDPGAPASEAYRSLRTSIQFMALDRPIRAIQVTSPNASEGKSTTVANLAVTLGNAGQRVVLVDCDLRRPRIHDFFDLHNDAGFTSVLLRERSLNDCLVRVARCPNLVLLPSGPLPPNPSELLSRRRTAELFAALQSEADVVVVDSPPVLPVTDAAVLSSQVHATLLVVGANTTRRELQLARDTLRQVNAPLVGTVLNGAGEHGAYGYAYYRRYEAGSHAHGQSSPATTARA